MSNSKTAVGKVAGVVLGVPLFLTLLALLAGSARAATCGEVQAKNKALAGKEIVIGISPFSPGYEVADPQDPSKIIGFDPDMISGPDRLHWGQA